MKMIKLAVTAVILTVLLCFYVSTKSNKSPDTALLYRLADDCEIGDKLACRQLKNYFTSMHKDKLKSDKKTGQVMTSDMVLENVAKNDIELAKKLETIKKENPHKFKTVTSIPMEMHICPIHGVIYPTKKQITRMTKLNISQYEVVNHYKNANSKEQKKTFHMKLLEILSERFDIETEPLKLKITDAKDNLDSLKQELKNRKKIKNKQISQEADMLLGVNS